MTEFEKASLLYLAHCARMLTIIAGGDNDDAYQWVNGASKELQKELVQKLQKQTIAFLNGWSLEE